MIITVEESAKILRPEVVIETRAKVIEVGVKNVCTMPRRVHPAGLREARGAKWEYK